MTTPDFDQTSRDRPDLVWVRALADIGDPHHFGKGGRPLQTYPFDENLEPVFWPKGSLIPGRHVHVFSKHSTRFVPEGCSFYIYSMMYDDTRLWRPASPLELLACATEEAE